MNGKPLIIGHRGASAIAPENTLGAFVSAIAAGADGIEFDVRLAADGVPVVIHDDSLKRTAGQPLPVNSLSSAELQRVNVGNWFARARKLPANKFAAETVPTLEQLFSLFSTNSLLLYLEIKCTPSEREQAVAASVKLIERFNLQSRVIVECFDLDTIAHVKNVEASIRTAALFEPKLAAPQALFAGQRLIAQARAAGADEIALHYKLAQKRLIHLARNAGLRVVVWTVDDLRWISKARDLEVEAIITNDPARMLAQRTNLNAD